jgi:hypothetical protein
LHGSAGFLSNKINHFRRGTVNGSSSPGRIVSGASSQPWRWTVFDRKLTALAATAALALAGCMSDSTRSDVADEGAPLEPEATPSLSETPAPKATVISPTTPQPAYAPGDGLTGIVVCDDYLSHYADVENRCIALETQMQEQLAGRECDFSLESAPLADSESE